MFMSLQTKVAAAAGALTARDELREARAKFKSETDALKAELKKLQSESNTGAKVCSKRA